MSADQRALATDEPEVRLRRTTLRIAALASVNQAVVTIPHLYRQEPLYPRGFPMSAFLVLVLAAVPLGWYAVRGGSDLAVVWPGIAVTTGVATVSALVVRHGSATHSPPWVAHLLFVSMCLAAVSLPRRLSVPVVGLQATVLLLHGTQPWTDLVLSDGEFLAGAIACLALHRAMHEATTDASNSRAELLNTALAAQDRAARTRERQWWDAVVHDKVLGALQAGSRGADPAQREASASLAREAVRALTSRVTSDPEQDPLLLIRQAAAHQGLRAQVEVTVGTPEADVLMATLGAIQEAVTNVARHAGVGDVRVDGIIDTVVDVTVRDDGRGFKPGAVDPARVGLRRAVIQRMRSVGGDAVITSSPGAGTQVRITTGTRQPVPTPMTRPWPRHVQWLLGGIALVMLGGLSVQGLMGEAADSNRGILVVGMLMVWFVSVMSWLPRASHAALVGFGTVGALAMPLLTLNIGPAHLGDDQLWFTRALFIVMSTLAVRHAGREAFALSMVGATTTTVLVLRQDPGAVSNVLVPLFQVPFIVLLAHLAVRRLDAIRRTAHATAVATMERRATIDTDRARDRERARRLAEMDAEVLPMLRRLAVDEDLPEDSRRDCARLETEARDRLVAGPLLDDEITRLISAARRSGARVSLSTADFDGDELGLVTVKQCLRLLLPRVSPASRMTVRWSGHPQAAFATLVLTAPLSNGASPEEWRTVAIVTGVGIERVEETDLVMVALHRREERLPERTTGVHLLAENNKA